MTAFGVLLALTLVVACGSETEQRKSSASQQEDLGNTLLVVAEEEYAPGVKFDIRCDIEGVEKVLGSWGSDGCFDRDHLMDACSTHDECRDYVCERIPCTSVVTSEPEFQ